MLPSLVIILLLIVIYLNYNKKSNLTNQIINIALIVVIMSFTYSHLKKEQLLYNDVEVEEENSVNSNSNESLESFQNKNPKKKFNKKSKFNEPNHNDEDEYYKAKADAEEIVVYSAPYSPIKDNKSNFQNIKLPKSGESITQSELKGTANVFKPTLIVNDGKDEKSISYKMRNNDAPTNLVSFSDYQRPANNLYGEDGDDAENDETDPYYNETTNYKGNLLSNQRDNSYENNIFERQEADMRRAKREANRREYQQQLQATDENRRCMNITTLDDRSCPYDVSNAEMAALKGKDKGKQYYPGYSFMPPETWTVPQERPPVCVPDKWIKRPSSVFDRGTPTNVLELDENGNMANNEDDVHFTNVGSILPKFNYKEL